MESISSSNVGVNLKLQCGTPYVLMDECSGVVRYALLGADSELFERVGKNVEVVGEETDAYPGAEYEVLAVKRIQEREDRRS